MPDSLFHRKLIAPLVALLTQGITPEKIAWSLAFGLALGVFPLLGSTTILCTAAALIFRLNLPAIQLVNFLAYPLQLFFLIFFIRAGEKLFHAAPLNLSRAQMLAMGRADLPHAVSILWLAGLHAMVAWFLVGPPAVLLLYFVLARALRRLAATSTFRTRSVAVI